MKIKNFTEYNTLNEEWFSSKKPIDKTIIEFEMIINGLPIDYDNLYTEIITDLNHYKKLPENEIVTKLLDLSNKVLNEISEIYTCTSTKKQLEDFIYKLERDYKIIEILPDSEKINNNIVAIEPEVIHIPTKHKNKNVKDYHNWSIDITPRVKLHDDDETF